MKFSKSYISEKLSYLNHPGLLFLVSFCLTQFDEMDNKLQLGFFLQYFLILIFNIYENCCAETACSFRKYRNLLIYLSYTHRFSKCLTLNNLISSQLTRFSFVSCFLVCFEATQLFDFGNSCDMGITEIFYSSSTDFLVHDMLKASSWFQQVKRSENK